jgi:type II secretory pathway component PulJ
MTQRHGQSGFSILEALISLTIFLLALTATFSVYLPAKQLNVHGDQRTQIQENARLALAQVVRQIRMAGWFPENFTSTPPSPLLANGVRLATDTAIAVYGDTDDSGASEVTMFCLQGTNLRRTMGAVATSTNYTCSNGDIIAEKVSSLRFTYYDASNNPVPAPPTTPYQLDSQNVGAVPNMTTTTQRITVRRVLVTLTAQATVLGKGPENYTLTSDVWIRNGG